MGRLAQNGVAVLVIFSKLPEITGICDRIMVMRGEHIQSKVGNRFDHGRREQQKPWGSSGSCSLEHEPSMVRSMTCSPPCIRPCPPTMSSPPHSLPQPELPHGFWCSLHNCTAPPAGSVEKLGVPAVRATSAQGWGWGSKG